MLINRDRLGFEAPPRSPRSETERELAEIWAAALNVDLVGVDDDFFLLGGDSLSAEVIAVAVAEAFGRALQPSDLMMCPTVADMAALLAGDATTGEWQPPSHVIMQRAGAGAAPVYFIHGGLGYYLPRLAFTDAIAPERPFFTIQVIGMRGEAETPKTINSLACAYLDSVGAITGERPFHLAAVCAGADIALEMACLMAEDGKRPLSLTLFDSGAPYRMRAHRSPLWFADARRWLRTESRRLRGRLSGDAEVAPQVTADGSVPKETPLTDAAARAIRTVDSARRRHIPRRWEGATHLIASRPGVEERVKAWRQLVGGLDVRITAEHHHDLLRGEAAAAGAAFEAILAAADPGTE